MRTKADKQQVYLLYDNMVAKKRPGEPQTLVDASAERSDSSAMDTEQGETQKDSCGLQKEFHVTSGMLQVGHSFLRRKDTVTEEGVKSLSLLHHCRPALESLIKCVQMNWMAILVSHHADINIVFYKSKILQRCYSLDKTISICYLRLFPKMTFSTKYF